MNLVAPLPLRDAPPDTLAAHRAVHAPPITAMPGGPCTVLVLGARGRLGYACVQAFVRAGWRVLAHVRSGSDLVQHQPATDASAGVVRWMDTPLDDEDAWQTCLQGYGKIDVVIHAMAPAFSTRAWAAQLHALNQAAVAVARRCQALLLTPLSILAYGRQLPDVMYEDDPIASAETSDSPMGLLRAHSELQLRMAAESGVQICTVRAGAFYGHAGDGWITSAIAQSLPQGRLAWLGPYDVATPWTYVHDLAQTLERVASQRHRMGEWTRLHFAGQQRRGQDWHDALSLLTTARGWTASPQALHAGQIPWQRWKPMGWFSPRIRALGELEYIWRTPHRLDNRRLLELIGTEPRTDWMRSLQEMVDVVFPAESTA